MIHHISIPASNPLRVAKVLAELCRGKVVPFTVHPGSYLVLMLDGCGTSIDIYPLGTEMVPGTGEQQNIFSHNPQASGFTATHIALSVQCTKEEIEAVAEREGWRSLHCSRDGLFEVIEFWIENRVLIELMPPDIAPQYLSLMQPRNLFEMLNAAAIPVL